MNKPKKRRGRRPNHDGSITLLADGRYQARITLPTGKRKAIYARTEKECMQKLNALKRRVEEGYLEAEDMTVKEYLLDYLEQKKLEVRESTFNECYEQCHNWLIPNLGKIKLSQLKPIKVQSLLQKVATERSPSASNRVRKHLKTALNAAMRLQLIPRNPVDATKKLKEPKKPYLIWTYQEAASFLSEAKQHELYLLFYLALSTGMRRSEILGLRWQDVFPDHLLVRHTAVEVKKKLIFHELTKTEKSNRKVMISSDLSQALLEHRAKQQKHLTFIGYQPEIDLVFLSQVGTPLETRNIRRVMQTLVQKANVPYINFHALRHWQASMLIEEGWDIREISRRLGHADPSITLRIYTHLFDKQTLPAPISLQNLLEPHTNSSEKYLN